MEKTSIKRKILTGLGLAAILCVVCALAFLLSGWAQYLFVEDADHAVSASEKEEEAPKNLEEAARAVKEKSSKAVIVGMDHDREALHFLADGVIYCLGVQDCYSIGFDTLQVAVKIADGHLPGELFPEEKAEPTTVIYQNDAPLMLELLYGDIS